MFSVQVLIFVENGFTKIWKLQEQIIFGLLDDLVFALTNLVVLKMF